LIITGPTASGKSDLALELAKRLGGEIISADSAQVYRGMDIGTAKPNAAIQQAVPHHLIDIRDPQQPYSAADFRKQCIALSGEIVARGNLPIIAGGTMLYLKALKEGLSELPEANQVLREAINLEAQESGWNQLHEQLQKIDPESAMRIKPNDSQRIQRAIEVFRLTGVPLTQWHKKSKEACPFPLLEIAIVPPDRKVLHEAIAARFHRMLAQGFVAEVEGLRRNPLLNANLPAIRAVGYRQIWSHLVGEVTQLQMIESGIAATRQLAKRQHTWLRSWQGLHQLDKPDAEQALKILNGSTILQ
jgi:tRNA dimethylallyltransferase